MAAGGPEIWFYEFVPPAEAATEPPSDPVEKSHLAVVGVLAPLLEKCLARDWRAVVRSPQTDRLEALDVLLWSYSDDGFLPHGLVTDPQPERQPVLLTHGPDRPNGAVVEFLLDDCDPGPLDGLVRSIRLFDGGDEGAKAAARLRWPAAKATGAPTTYWLRSDTGRWEKKA
ncbi:MAG: DNA polymerase III subunit chi [Maricaulaceae bacterium]